jgi:hypothetical protein
LSNTAWAFAKLGFSSAVLFEALAEAAVGKLDAFTAQGLSNTAWAYATMGHYHPALVEQLAEQVGVGSRRLQELVGHFICNAACISSMGLWDSRMRLTVVERSIPLAMHDAQHVHTLIPHSAIANIAAATFMTP